MNKVRVLQLSGCSKCHTLTAKLDAVRISYELVDADENTTLADTIEQLLNAVNYPIVTIEQSPITTHIYRATDSVDMGLYSIDHHTNKIGCATVDGILDQIINLLKK